METFYLVIVVVLFALAISDLIVGVSNDAVNFLNSAIGSKAAPFKLIMIIAALGVLVGATFSSGLMEVARKGIFHPDQFSFAEIMVVFLAVMITDVILLDSFNTFGLPTSTTVSIVFELLGAAVAVSTIKILTIEGVPEDLSNYINSAKALAIISGILLSVVIAFSVGSLIQYFVRLAFTFNYVSKMKYYGAIWGGIAITAIVYFILIKGAKGSSFITSEDLVWIKANTLYIIFFSFIGFTLLLQIISLITRINILKIIVLIGTFALAMAFAGNDLVNFIGVPLAGYESFKSFISEPGASVDTLMMTALTGKIKTPTYFLLIAGGIMVITLWTSKKARSVVATTLDLSRQKEGAERFESTILSRAVVRGSRKLNDGFKFLIPKSVQAKIDRRFEIPKYSSDGSKLVVDQTNFDLIRASVTLVVSSVLISIGTSLKLPLSTTYVTFMVAMGTSLSDRAWGRESAVYRITGVLSVVGGWFLTALSAFTFAFVVATAIYYGGMFAVIGFILLALFFVLRTHYIHKKREKESDAKKEYDDKTASMNEENIVQKSSETVTDILSEIPQILSNVFTSLSGEKLKKLQKNYQKSKEIRKKTKYLKENLHKTIDIMEADSVESGQFYVQVIDYLRELSGCIFQISFTSFKHIDNNHKGFIPVQDEETTELAVKISNFFNKIIYLIQNNDFNNYDEVNNMQEEILIFIEMLSKNQVKRIKAQESGTKNSLLYLNLLSETKNMMQYLTQLLKSMREFVRDHPKNV